MESLLALVGFRSEAAAKLTNHLGDWLLELLLQLQQRLFFPVCWRKLTHRIDGATELGFEVGRSAWSARLVEHALGLVRAALSGSTGSDVEKLLAALDNRLTPRLSYLFRQDRHKTAARLGIYRPTHELLDVAWSYLGQGTHACLVAGGSTSRTSAIGKELAGDKRLALRRLRLNGLPVLPQLVVESSNDAVAAARQLGYPVVVKPLRGRQSKGVSVNVNGDEAMQAAFGRAQSRHAQVVVEPHQSGLDYRMLVIAGQFVAAVRRDRRVLLGDGHSSIIELVEQENRSVRGTGLFFSPITLDDDALGTLATQGHTPESVPEDGERLHLQQMASPQSTAADVTSEVHPDNRQLAVDAAATCLLDVAGIDFVSSDICTSWRANGARVIEVNAGPAADLHMFPQAGQARDVSWHLIRACLPASSPGRLPVVMCLGRKELGAYVNPIASQMTQMAYQVGRQATATANPASIPALDVAALLTNPAFDAAVIGWPLSRVASEGFPVDRVRVVVMSDPLPLDAETLSLGWGADLTLRTCQLACDLATHSVVIDGGNALLRAAVSHRPAEQVGYLWWASPEADDTPLRQHLAAGGWAITSEDVPQVDDRDKLAAMLAMAVLRTLSVPRHLQQYAQDSVWHDSPAEPATTAPWTPADLARLFCGTWVNGPESGWEVTRMVSERCELVPGDVFVCKGRPDDLTQVAATEAEILSAFGLGARAVVATQVPPNLPRWQPVLVCDDPEAGLRRVGSAGTLAH
jgi:cyanophycin synthetase